MPTTYNALLKGRELDWIGERPENIPPDRAVPVQVTILEEPSSVPAANASRQRMMDALEKLAALNGIRGITDPAAWQREQREDRPLPGRNR